MEQKWTWKDLVGMVCELITENTVDTYCTECDECDGPMSSLDFIADVEMEQFLEHIKEDVNENMGEILENARKSIKELGCECD